MQQLKIIGISGTNGAGKDTLADWLADQGWLFVSVSDLLREELNKRGLPIERENLRNLSAQWRREFGLGVLIDRAVSEYERLSQKNDFEGLVVSSIRNSGEADRIHELGGQVVWIDADAKIRYERIMGRMRGTEDRKTFQQFLAEEQAEMSRSGDVATLDMTAVKEKTDIFIQNDTKTLDEFIELAKNSLGFAGN
jgi:dephospho-CoA kinase